MTRSDLSPVPEPVASAGLRRVLWLALALSVGACWLPAAAVVWLLMH